MTKGLPSSSKFSGFRQLCNLILCHLVSKLPRETGVDKFCRAFSEWSHGVAMLYAQFSLSIGLNNVCNALRLNSGLLSAIRGATPPSRHGISHAGKHRKAVLAEKLFWSVLDHLQTVSLGFGRAISSMIFSFSTRATYLCPVPHHLFPSTHSPTRDQGLRGDICGSTLTPWGTH